LENLLSGAHQSTYSSHHARAHVPEFISHMASMSRTTRHAPAATGHLTPSPICGPKQPSPPLCVALCHFLPLTAVARHRSKAAAGSSRFELQSALSSTSSCTWSRPSQRRRFCFSVARVQRRCSAGATTS
jgi:hypothetical protein